MPDATETGTVTIERQGRVLLIGLNRPEAGNAMTSGMLRELIAAFTLLEDDDDLWVGLLFGHGPHLTVGLDLAEISPHLGNFEGFYDERSVDPFGVRGRVRTKPLVAAAHGWVITAGVEMLLNADVRVAAESARFSQMEVQRGILPFGGGTIRWPKVAGWGNAMRWILTGDVFDAAEAYRIGVVQQIAPDGKQLDRARILAQRIAMQAPLAVRATMAAARTAAVEGERAGAEVLMPALHRLTPTRDAAEGVASFVEKRKAEFNGT